MSSVEQRIIKFSPPDISESEVEEVANALRSGWITTGPRTKKLEKMMADYVGTERCVCLNSATACLEMTLRLLGVGEGDEVITSAYTYTASASPVCHVGARLVLVDTAKDSFEMDYERLEEAITENTKVIIPVDIAGKMCDYERIYTLVERKKALFRAKNEIQEAFGRIIIVADAAHAFGAKMRYRSEWKTCGAVADFTSFSFHAVKNLTTAEGGAVTWKPVAGIDDEWIYKQYMLLSLHGQTKDALAKTKLGMWEYDIVAPAYKCNMTDIMAAIGLKQLERYPELLRRRRELIELYNRELKGLGLLSIRHYDDENESSGHLYMVRIPGATSEQRNRTIEKLAEQGIASNVHYKPLPMLTAYKNLGFDIGDYPNAYKQFENEITLPLHTLLSDEDVMYIATTLKGIVKEYGIGC